jgi:hypothetical protein
MFSAHACFHPEKPIDHTQFYPDEGDLFDWLNTPYVRPLYRCSLINDDPCIREIHNENNEKYAYQFYHVFQRSVNTGERHVAYVDRPLIVDNTVEVRLTVNTCFTESSDLFKVEILGTKITFDVSYLGEFRYKMRYFEQDCLQHNIDEVKAYYDW